MTTTTYFFFSFVSEHGVFGVESHSFLLFFSFSIGFMGIPRWRLRAWVIMHVDMGPMK